MQKACMDAVSGCYYVHIKTEGILFSIRQLFVYSADTCGQTVEKCRAFTAVSFFVSVKKRSILKNKILENESYKISELVEAKGQNGGQ